LDSFRCREFPELFETELCGKAPTKEKHGEFVKQNLGNTERKNLNGAPLSECYSGTAHFCFRSAETLCLRIAKIAAGKMCLFKLVYTDCDCIVPENIHIFPREGFFGLNPPRHQKFFFSFTFLETMEVGICRVVTDLFLELHNKNNKNQSIKCHFEKSSKYF